MESDSIDRVNFYGGMCQFKFDILFWKFTAQCITIKPLFVSNNSIYNQSHERQI
jgi:hypothetical protein